MKEIYEVDINKSYFLDDDLNIWEDLDDFYKYHLEEYTGIKDNLEVWQDELCTDHNVLELMGDEIIERVVRDLDETIEYWRDKYFKTIS